MSCIIFKKTWSVISKLFLLNSIFHYISNWSKVLEFYLTSFFNMKSWRVKFINFLGDFPVHYVALLIKRTINNNYMTLLMTLHHTHGGIWYYYTTVSMEVTSSQEKQSPLFWQSAWKKYKATRMPIYQYPPKNFNFPLSGSLKHSTLNKCGFYFFAEYKLVK